MKKAVVLFAGVLSMLGTHVNAGETVSVEGAGSGEIVLNASTVEVHGDDIKAYPVKGSVQSWRKKSDYLSWTVNVKSDVIKTFAIELGSTKLNGGVAAIEIDGDEVFEFEVPNTGTWKNYKTLNLGDYYLDKGIHEINVRCVSLKGKGGLMNLNGIKIND